VNFCPNTKFRIGSPHNISSENTFPLPSSAELLGSPKWSSVFATFASDIDIGFSTDFAQSLELPAQVNIFERQVCRCGDAEPPMELAWCDDENAAL
jgi:hypothetical protein